MRNAAASTAVVFGAFLVGGNTAIARLTIPQAAATLLPQPASWVPFSAKVTVEHPNGDPVAGAFYRDSSGSTRLETGPPNSDVRVVSIKNVPSRTQYVRRPDGTWMSTPMRGNDATLAPLPFHAELKGLALLPKKVSIRAGEPYSLESDSGFLVYLTHKATADPCSWS